MMKGILLYDSSNSTKFNGTLIRYEQEYDDPQRLYCRYTDSSSDRISARHRKSSFNTSTYLEVR